MISVIIESELLLSSSLSWEDVNGSFHRISSSIFPSCSKRNRLWSFSASQLPRESKPSRLQNVEMKKKKNKNRNNSALWWRILTAERALIWRDPPEKYQEKTQEGSFIFSAATPILLLHTERQRAGTMRGEEEEREEKESAEI